jgi:multiple antibiotic resistance protein
MNSALNTFLLVLAAIFPVVNPPGSALVFLGLTRGASPETRRLLAKRVARNSFFVLLCSLLLGALILEFYGISIPVLRVAGGLIVAASGWNLLNEGSQKESQASSDGPPQTNLLDQAFYPLTLPLTTGPGTIAVVISLGLGRASYASSTDEVLSFLASLAAVVADSVVRRQRASALCHSCWPPRVRPSNADRNSCSRSLSELSSRPKRQVI